MTTIPADSLPSFLSRTWRPAQTKEAIASSLRARGLPARLGEVVAAREAAWEDPDGFLFPKMRTLMPNPFTFKGMTEGAKRLAGAVLAHEKIGVWGDYDVDGATSSAIMARFFRALGIDVKVHIPDRIKEGYGPNIAGMKAMAEEGYNLIVVVDSGTTAFDVLAEAKAAGIEVIVIDHHQSEDRLPDCAAVINPNRYDESGDYGYLCAAAVSFMAAIAVRSLLNEDGRCTAAKSFDLMALLDLVALGTVADVVPLVGLNRAFVQNGLKIMERRGNPGIAALMDKAGITGAPKAWHCGFLLGPRVNAGGRIGQAETASVLLSSDDPEYCKALAERLDSWNHERQAIEKACVTAAREQVEAAEASSCSIALGEDWHEGVIGIVAGRVKEMFNRPTFCFTKVGEGRAKGSGRSMTGFDMGRAVIEARNAGLLIAGGGHAMAAGVTIELDKMKAFQTFMEEKISQSEFARIGPVMRYDTSLDLAETEVDLIDTLSVLEPYGQSNPKPRFLISGARLSQVETMGKTGDHLKLSIEQGGVTRKAVAFGAVKSPLGEGMMARHGGLIDLVVTLERNEWRGRVSVDLFVEDAREHAGEPEMAQTVHTPLHAREIELAAGAF